MTRRHEDWFDDVDIDRAHIFVPAIMSAGIVLSAVVLVRDALHAKVWRGRSRSVRLYGEAVAHHVLTGEPPDRALTRGLRPRVSYALAGIAAGALAAYVGIGATLNYLRPGGYVEHVAWLWGISVLTTASLTVVSGACLVVFGTWRDLPGRLRPLLVRTPLGQVPVDPGSTPSGPPLLLSWAASAALVVAALFTFVVAAAPHRVEGIDDWFARTAASWDLGASIGALGGLGEVWLALALAAGLGLAAVRCPPFAALYPATVLVGAGLDVVLRALVPRAHPLAGPLADVAGSFPSGQALQATLVAGLVPAALWVLTRRRWLVVTVAALLTSGVVGVVLAGLATGERWWSDLAAGVLWGGALLLGDLWILEHRRWHRHCADCPWAGPRRGSATDAVRLSRTLHRRLRWAVRAWVPLAVLAFTALAISVGVPTNPEGDILGSQVERPAQFVLLTLAMLAWAIGWRWEAPAAALLAVVGSLLGVFAAVAYAPLLSLVVTVAFLAPAVGYWTVWQRRSTARAIVVLGLTTGLLLVGTGVSAALTYDRFYGPAHPTSATAALRVDRVLWMWSGGVSTDRAAVVAELTGEATRARLVVDPSGGGPQRTGPAARPGDDHVVRLEVTGLRPGTRYRYTIEVDGRPDTSRGIGTFRTAPAGAASFTVAFGSCARTGSNGAVFDAIREVDPLLYVTTGDLHYGNPSRNSVGLFANLYRRTLTAPAQAALYRQVPAAYLWDDHDYGPNDADASAATRPAARTAYRRYVPHYSLQSSAIYQAFTVGRVRFVLTDTRSERTATTMLGTHQRDWLKRELVTASRTHSLVVWVNPDPWIAPADPSRDDWGGHSDERRELADVIADAGIRNLVMVAGDAHMVALDDGSNSDYSSSGRGGFPVLHAAALDRPGSRKGGPYSEGEYPGAGQFGTLRVEDSGGTVTVTLAGHDWRGRTLVSKAFSVPGPGPR